MGLNAVIGTGVVALDTSVFIYFIEEHPRFLPLIAPVFEATARGECELVTSAVTLLEVLVVPYRAGNLALAERYEALLTQSRGVRLVDLDRHQLRAAAQLRATYGMRTPDAVQVAVALSCGCAAFVTNDRKLPQLSGIRIIQLREHLASL